MPFSDLHNPQHPIKLLHATSRHSRVTVLIMFYILALGSITSSPNFVASSRASYFLCLSGPLVLISFSLRLRFLWDAIGGSYFAVRHWFGRAEHQVGNGEQNDQQHD